MSAPVKPPSERLYQRRQGRWYADFRDLAAVGGGQEAMVPDGERRATTDRTIAEQLAAARLATLLERRTIRKHSKLNRVATISEYAAEHLLAKAQSNKFTDAWLAQSEKYLTEAAHYFGENRLLHDIELEDVERWIAHLRKQGLADGSVHHRLSVLSNLYKRAIARKVVPLGYNPVAAMLSEDRPNGKKSEAEFFEPHHGALILEASKLFVARHPDVGWPFLPQILAVAFLTGGRASEVLALEVNEVNLDKQTVWYRRKETRRVKTEKSDRPLRLWPQLDEYLRPYLKGPDAPTGLLFPNVVNGAARRITAGNPKWRRQLDALGDFIQWKPTHPLEPAKIRLQPCRNSYAAQRLQCLDNGQPIAWYTVQRELGHSDTDTLQRIYAHLGQVRHRSELLEFRPEHYEKQIGKRLRKLQEAAR